MNEINQDIDYSRRGPWDSPLKEFNKEKPIIVIMHDLQHETIEREWKLDYGNYEDRKFLGKLTFFAVTTGRSIETMSIDDWEKVK